tara:strand:+ start:608194 stop:608472 length:279 start_codon:yes stop_codon:yes gene_type:complete
MNKKAPIAPTLSAAFALSALALLSGCMGNGRHSCTGGQNEAVDITWGSQTATAIVTKSNGDRYEASSVNRFHLAKAYVQPLGGTCASWDPKL